MRTTLCALLFVAALPAEQPGTITIDTQEWRSAPAKHFYVHGTLNGDTAFHVFLPEPKAWRGRVAQWLQGGLGGSETAGVGMGNHIWALANGAAYVESSQGHVGDQVYLPRDTPREIAYQANYAVMQYAKARCVELYAREPSFSYVFGGSGGGIRASGLLERFPKAYDGGVSVVGVGEVDFVAYLYSRMETFRPRIQDRVEALAAETRVPGTGDPFRALAGEGEKRALREVLATGYPRNSLWLLRPLVQGVTILDFMKYQAAPGYLADFWTRPGFAGKDGELANELVQGAEGTVKAVQAAQGILETDLSRKDHELYAWTITFTSGALKGEWRRVWTNLGSRLAIGRTGPGIDSVRPGDRFTLDNRDLLAWRTYHRYVADDAEEPTMRPLVRGGKPIYPTLAPELRDGLKEPDRPLGRLQTKLIALCGSDDPLMWPTVPSRYHRLVKKALGARIDDHFRLHFLEHGVHGAVPPNLAHRQVPNRTAALKALTDVMAWVEQGMAPVPGTTYSMDDLNQLVLPAAAAQRKGYQPVVKLSANSKTGRMEVPQGQEVSFQVQAEDPDNEIIQLEMDYEGDGKFDQSRSVRGKRVIALFPHRYEKAGAYFPTVRATDSTTIEGSTAPGIQNLAVVGLTVSPTPKQ
jgi:hypothetical protein